MLLSSSNRKYPPFPSLSYFSVVVCLRCLWHHILLLIAYTFRKNREFVFTIIVEEQAPKPVGWMMSFLLMTFVPVQELRVNIYIYIYICIFYYEFCYRMYIYMQQEWHSVLVKLHLITFYRTVLLGSAQFLGWMTLFVFFGLPIVSCSLMITV